MLDASIYQNVSAPKIDLPNPMDAAGKALTLSQLGMQNQQMQQQMLTQQAMRQAYAKNMGEDGQLNRTGFLSDLGRVNPMAAQEQSAAFAKMDKEKADAQVAQMQALHQQASVAVPHYGYLLSLPDDKAAEAWPDIKNQLQSSGVDPKNLPDQWNRNLVQRGYQVANHYKEQIENALTQANTSKANAEADKTRSETIKQNPGLLGQTDDPAKLVPKMVPKEHQAKAFAEIDAAENTRKMSESILKAFDQAVDDTTGTGRVTSLVKTPRSVQALHQAMQPTFKDLEGTVRQAAMDNTFKNITPNAADTDADRATKRAALQDYLQSKLSAPTARAYGIDLSKFASTAPYKGNPQKVDASQDSGTLSKSAYAAPPQVKAGAVEDGYVFMGGDPGKPSSWKRAR